jgi:hypothetical protein
MTQKQQSSLNRDGTNFQTAENSGVFPPIANQEIPVGLIVGTLDGVSDLGETASTYVRIQDPSKALITVKGANHYGLPIKIAIAIQVVRHSIKLRQPERSDAGVDYFYGRNSSAIKVRLTMSTKQEAT